MNKLSAVVACILIATGVATAIAYGYDSEPKSDNPPLAPFVFHREGAVSPEAAAKALFRGVARESPKDFVKHLLLGVCDGPIDTLQKFAECLHVTKFSHGEDQFTFYDLRDGRKGINPKKPFRVVKTEPFDTEDKQVAALQMEMMRTYYGKAFTSVDVAGEGYDGEEYQTRIVVAEISDRWYAIPRCRSSNNFYVIADAINGGRVGR